MEGLSVRMAMTIDEGEEFEDTKGVIKIVYRRRTDNTMTKKTS
jgi:hypothetical protein